jgi:hypothetical protein
MLRALAFTDAVGYCALAFVTYKTVELGPYEAAILFGRCLRVFIAAAQGYL